MTVIFPHPDDEQVEPFLAPFGRMMFGYGRAMIALREVAEAVLGSEEKAVDFMRGVKSSNMVEKFRDLCAQTFEDGQLNELLKHIETLSSLYQRRNIIVHGEWWFNVFEDDALSVRDWDRKAGEPIHDETITPETLDQLAIEFDDVSQDIDVFSYRPKVQAGRG
ncbi:hypothetical protein E4K66_13440 [Bradyrhizobium frederickii]|uniref:Uncharacterized protein n=1 Tax=Bradyrhizobium frederickii TaxID=2560054 RepID=A0A4Y9LBR8_9BRAD|nr:hypothetical protein [Bradyrhizobium frederickii]TFV39403.1 hypothetical protein E4K66_13440 [Bradyrhizobium frederickii]